MLSRWGFFLAMTRVQSPTFGELLRRYRAAAGLTQEALAERAGLGARTISDLERGVANRPQRHTLRLLADALGLPPRDRSRLEAAAVDNVLAMVSSGESGERATASALSPFVGRTTELTMLESHVNEESPPLLMLAGEPGIGKTRLLREGERYGIAAAMTVLRGGCQRRSAQEPYTPVVEALSDYIDRQPAAQLGSILKGCSWLIRLLPELADVLPAPPGGLHPTQERRLLFRAVIRFLRNVAGPGGVLLELDDLQWAGTDALDLLGTLVRSAAEIPLQVIGAYRDTEIGPEDELSVMLAELARSDLTVHRSLGPLLPVEATALLSALVIGIDGTGTHVEEQVFQRAGGVPFFLVSYAQGLREGSLNLDRRQQVPWTTAQSIRQRVASLPDDARQVVNAAAVAGRVVPRALVMAVAGRQEAAAAAGLDAACRGRLLETQPGHTYRFTHDLIREVIEADLGAAQRTLLHRRIGRARERVPDQQRGQYAAELAWHFREGDEPERALPYTILAGDQAEAVFAHGEAERHYRTALELAEQLGDTLRQAEVLEKLGFVLFLVCRLTESHEVSVQAMEMYHAMGNLQREGWALNQIAGVRESPDEGIARIEPLLDPLQAQGPSPILVKLHENIAWLLSLNGRYRQSLAAAERGCEVARALEDERLLVGPEHVRGHVLVQLGQVRAGLEVLQELNKTQCFNWSVTRFAGEAYTMTGELDEARLCFERALAGVEQIGEPATLALHLGLLSSHLCLLGNWNQARIHIDAAEAIIRSAEMQWEEPLIVCLRVRGQLCLAEGRWADAVHYLQECIAVCERPGNVKFLAQAHLALAEVDLLQGHADVVRARLDTVLTRSDLSAADVTGLLPFLAWAHLEMNDPVQADANVKLAVERATATGMRLYLADALRVKGMVARHRRQHQEAEDTFRDALELARALRHTRAEGWILYESGLNENDEGNREVALQRLEEALAIFRRLSIKPLVERTEQALVEARLTAGD
jgi:tetratricopeptide (TPR) repeat protein/transcriptional regulator with XRE-family HTH domain